MKQLYIVQSILKFVLALIGNQCSWNQQSLELLYFPRCKTNLAHIFWIRRNLCNLLFEILNIKAIAIIQM